MAGLRPPKLAAWSGWAARLPAGASSVVVVTPGARVVCVGDWMAFWRLAAFSHAGAAMSTGSPKSRPPLVEVATTARVGLALGAVTNGVENCQLM